MAWDHKCRRRDCSAQHESRWSLAVPLHQHRLPKYLIVAGEFSDALTAALPELRLSPEILIHGLDHDLYQRIDLDIRQRSGETLSREERRPLSIGDRALYIYTSGTTGLPKAANISHARVLQWSHWFAGIMGAQPSDRMYNCLPMYHSIGGVLVPGAILIGGGAIVIREKFSTTHIWDDVIRWDCTMFQYIGELCRYLLHAAPSPNDRSHRIRMACGNGLASEVWDAFKDRFKILKFLSSMLPPKAVSRCSTSKPNAVLSAISLHT